MKKGLVQPVSDISKFDAVKKLLEVSNKESAAANSKVLTHFNFNLKAKVEDPKAVVEKADGLQKVRYCK